MDGTGQEWKGRSGPVLTNLASPVGVRIVRNGESSYVM
jgi:hypothetical protein